MTGYQSKKVAAQDKLAQPVQEALKLALEALENPWKAGPDGVADAITAIKEALAQPAQEPVASCNGMPAYEGPLSKALTQYLDAARLPDTPSARAYLDRVLDDDDDIQVYKRPWVGLTDDDIKEIVGPWGDTPIKGYTRKLFDQIEAKLREKNT